MVRTAVVAGLACIALTIVGCERKSAPAEGARSAETRGSPPPHADAAATPKQDDGRATQTAVAPADSGQPVFPEGLVIGGECPPASEAVTVAANTPPLVPLEVGLTLAHVWKPHSESGDEEYECLLQVTAITSSYADVTYTCDHRDTVARRRICVADLRDSHFYLTEAGGDQPPVTSGATMFSLSTRSLQDLKASTNTAHRYIEVATGWQHRKQPLSKDTDGNLHSGRFDRETYQVIVNDHVAELPVLTGLAFGNKRRQTAITVLDDERLPLVLDYSVISEGFRIRYTKISFPTNGELEKHLSIDKRADVYGIYFDFGSDRLRPESAPVLEEIAALLSKNPTWALSINGHTDNIGGDASNLALSRRRSAAVRAALIDQYHIDGARLVTSGFGASQPKGSNDTPEGRSANRRVELVRQ